MNKTVAVALLLVVACGDGRPTTVLVSPEAAELEMLHRTVRLTASVKDQNGSTMNNASVRWSSEDTNVATVDAAGIVTAMGNGVVRILATEGTVSGAATITVALVQRDALLKLYESLNGDDWSTNRNWGTRTALDTWVGVQTDEDGNVHRLTLRTNNVSGALPAEVGLLKHLRGLDLSFNEALTGTIPPEIGDLENLEGLWLHHNDLTGHIPPEIANLTRLDTLDLHHNRLTGPLPTWLGDLEDLHALVVWGNALTGPLPASLGNLDLERLEVDHTALSGELPRTLIGLGLVGFSWGATDLCSPRDDEFQDWLKTIPDHRGGRVCPP